MEKRGSDLWGALLLLGAGFIGVIVIDCAASVDVVNAIKCAMQLHK